MPPIPVPAIVTNLSSTNPPAQPGYILGKWQKSADYPVQLLINNEVVTVMARDASVEVPNPGSGGSVGTIVAVPLAPMYAGNFTVAHGSPQPPVFVIIVMTSGGAIWLQNPLGFDATNLYLTASAAGITGIAYVWPFNADQIIPFTTAAAGNFTTPHSIGVTPGLVLIEMDSGGAVWFQTPGSDASNIYLTASAAGIVGRIIVFKNAPILTVRSFAQIALAPSAAGNFTVPHGLGKAPIAIMIEMTSGGAIWEQTPTGSDATNLYLVASAGGITGVADVWT